jgi:hypothetical protein
VEPVIERNRRDYATDNVCFHLFSGDYDELPEADLLIAKDVLQHWSNETISSFLPHLDRYRYALVTNCADPYAETRNVDIRVGEFRYLDIRQPPFNVDAREIYSFTNYRPPVVRFFVRPRWRKRVLLRETCCQRD